MDNVPLTQPERDQFSLAVFMLSPFVDLILRMMADGKPMDLVAAELVEFIPSRLDDQVLTMARFTAERGPGVLALISPRLATPQGAELIQQIALILSQEVESFIDEGPDAPEGAEPGQAEP